MSCLKKKCFLKKLGVYENCTLFEFVVKIIMIEIIQERQRDMNGEKYNRDTYIYISHWTLILVETNVSFLWNLQ